MLDRVCSVVIAGIGIALLPIQPAATLALTGARGSTAAGPPRTDEVIAIVTATSQSEDESYIECVGVDGAPHVEVRVLFKGVATSDDPRLEGDFTGHSRVLVDRNTLKGTVRDDFEVVDPTSGALKVKGTGRGVFDDFGAFKGLVVADVRDGVSSRRGRARTTSGIDGRTRDAIASDTNGPQEGTCLIARVSRRSWGSRSGS